MMRFPIANDDSHVDFKRRCNEIRVGTPRYVNFNINTAVYAFTSIVRNKCENVNCSISIVRNGGSVTNTVENHAVCSNKRCFDWISSLYQLVMLAMKCLINKDH